MIQKFLAKYILEVIPSIVATVIGAYIVTHYINAKTEADKPNAAVSAPATPVKAVSAAPDKPKAESAKTDTVKPEPLKSEPAKAEAVRSEPEPVKSDTANGEPEKAASEKSAQAARVLHRHQLLMKERATAKATVPAPAEANVPPPEGRDANEIARAAIERLRSTEPRAAETAKTPERAKVNTVVYAPVQTAPSVQQALPPAAYVPPPAREASIPMSAPMPTTVAPLPVPPPPSAPLARINDPSRPTPPADIPLQPLDIRAKENNTSVAEDVVSAAKSAFQAVLPR